jgi:hypothetical protein
MRVLPCNVVAYVARQTNQHPKVVFSQLYRLYTYGSHWLDPLDTRDLISGLGGVVQEGDTVDQGYLHVY